MAMSDEGGKPPRKVRGVAAENLICTLTVKHDFDPSFLREAEDSILRIDAGARKRLVLAVDELREIPHEFVRAWMHLMRSDA